MTVFSNGMSQSDMYAILMVDGHVEVVVFAVVDLILNNKLEEKGKL